MNRAIDRIVLPVAILLACSLVTSSVLARDVRVAGFGTRKCADWVDWKTKQNGEYRALAVEWINGFIAGHNIYARVRNEPANSVVANASTLLTLLDSYCQKNLESKLLEGAIDITQSLGGAKVTLTPKAPAAGQIKPGGEDKSPKNI